MEREHSGKYDKDTRQLYANAIYVKNTIISRMK